MCNAADEPCPLLYDSGVTVGYTNGTLQGARPDNAGPGAGDVLQQTFQVLQNMMSGMALQHVETVR